MRVVTFAPSLTAAEAEGGGIDAKGFPMTSCYVESVPAEITIPVVIAVCALAGDDSDAVRYLIASSPKGEVISTMQFSWRWDDVPGVPVKYRVFLQNLPVVVRETGVYTLGLYDSADGGETAHSFPLPISQANSPLLGRSNI